MADPVPNQEKSSSGGGSRLVPIMLGVNFLLVAGVIVLFFLRGGLLPARAAPEGEAAAAQPGAAKGPPAPGPTARLPDFVIHLRNVEADRYARISFEVELGAEEQRPALTAFMPRIRDAFISYLSDRTVDELRGSAAIEKTKTALAERLSSLAPGVTVRGLYVTDLVIQ